MKALAPAIFALAALSFVACSSDTNSLDGGGNVPADAGMMTTTSTCANDDACPADQYCEDTMNVCVPGTGNDCEDDSDCPDHQRCEIVTDCGANRCHGNTCEDVPCTRNQDCPDTTLCINDVCAPAPTCDDMNPCPDGSSCVNGTCEADPPTACTEDDDCPDPNDICVFGECSPLVTCTSTTSCPGDLVCQGDECREPCMTNADCGMGGRCDMATGICQQRCFGDGLCPSGQICESFLCVPAECTDNSDCDQANDEECVGQADGHGRCVVVERCMDDTECDANFVCRDGVCRELPRCIGDRGCDPDEFCDDGHCQPSVECPATPCPADQVCVGSRCVPGGCRGLEDCPTPGEICIGGVCQAAPAPTPVIEVRIITPAGIVRPGASYTFTAIALNQAGAVVPGVTFEWTSTSTQVAAIDAGGVAVGGNRAGVTQIIASVETGVMTVSSTPVRLTNLGAVAQGTLRVTAIDLASGSAVSNAAVRVEAANFTATSTTNNQGIAEITGAPASALTITVADSNHDFVSLIGVTGNDIVVPLPPLTALSRAGGLRGGIDLSMVSSTGAIGYSLSGGSFAAPLHTFAVADLFGAEVHQVDVNIPGGGGFQIPVGASATLDFAAFGMMFNLKETYYSETRQGLRAAWSFGGRLDASIFTGGGGAGGDILGATLPFFQRFQHAVRPAVPVIAIDRVVDTADLDNDGDTTELQPDYLNLPEVPLTPTVQQSLRYEFAADGARLPFVTGGNADTLIIVTGTLLPGIGFVPLGLDGLQDGGGNGLVETFTTRVAPPHSGLEVGQFAVLATAFRATQGFLPPPGSTRLVVADNLPTTVDISDGWIDAPMGNVYDQSARSLTVGNVMGAEVTHVQFATNDGAWHVYAPSSQGAITIPASPLSMDRTQSATITATALDLEMGADLSSVFAVGAGASALDQATRGFAQGTVAQQP